MEEKIITNDDLQYLTSISSDNLNLILAGMTSLMEANNGNIHMLENQNWFQRMWKTISGKNKIVQQDIEHNHDKINLYVTEALGELYSRNCINYEIILGLGNKINELYESQVEIKQIIGAFAQKLNQKIESIDNYHMLVEEINQGVYNGESSFVSISKIMSQLDIRTVNDNRKMEILVRAMKEKNIIDNKEIPFYLMLEETLKLSESDAGILAMFFGNVRDEYIAEIAEKTIYTYYMLPEKIRKMKSRHSIVENILKANDIDLEYSISSAEICETLIQAYIDNIVEATIEKQKNEEDEKRDYVLEYMDDSIELLILLCNMVETWEAKNGELNTHKSRKEYANFMNSLIDNLDRNSYIGNSIIVGLNNMTYFIQNVFSKHEELRITEVTDQDIRSFKNFIGEEVHDEEEISQKVNRNVALALPTYDLNTDTSGTKYQTVAEYYLEFINDQFNNPSLGRTRELYSLEILDLKAEDFPDPGLYMDFEFRFRDMKTYAAMFNTAFDNIIEKLNDTDFLCEVFNLCKKFPCEYDGYSYDVLVRDIDSIPHIELKYKAHGVFESQSVGYANLGFLKDYETTTVLVKFVNVNIKNYTAHYHVIENSYIDTSTWDSYKYVDVAWGEWVESDTLELHITKNNSENIGTLKIKVCVKENPEIVAYIQA